MDLSSPQLTAFEEVARLLSFTQASKSLHLTQSALSQRVKNLENDLGLSLFIRAKEGIRLTESGSELLRYCKAKRSLESEMIGRLKNNQSGELFGMIRIGGISSVTQSILIPSLAPLMRSHSNLELKLFTAENFELMDLLKRGEIEYVISDQVVDQDDLIRTSLGSEAYVLVQKRNDRSISDTYLDHDEHDVTTRNYLRKAKLPTKNLKRLYLDDVYGVIAGVKNGMGKAVLPEHLIEDQKSLETLNPNVVMEVSLYLYYYHQPFYSQLHEKTIAQIHEGFGSLRE